MRELILGALAGTLFFTPLKLVGASDDGVMPPTVQQIEISSGRQDKALINTDIVSHLDTAASQRVAVRFQKHAAVYFLPRSHEHFAEWYARLKTSRDAGNRVRFTYKVAGQELTGVELLE